MRAFNYLWLHLNYSMPEWRMMLATESVTLERGDAPTDQKEIDDLLREILDEFLSRKPTASKVVIKLVHSERGQLGQLIHTGQ